MTSSRISRQVEQLFVGLDGDAPQRGDATKIAILIVDNVSTDPDLTVEMAEQALTQGRTARSYHSSWS